MELVVSWQMVKLLGIVQAWWGRTEHVLALIEVL